MSGPALKQLNAHRAIHDAAYNEADEMTIATRNFAEAGQVRAAIATVRLLIEHWQTRTLQHAAEEEAGFYKELLEKDPEKVADIAALTRDHDLMRHLLKEVEELVRESGSFQKMIDRLEMLLWLNLQHSREEEHRLLEFEEQASRRAVTDDTEDVCDAGKGA